MSISCIDGSIPESSSALFLNSTVSVTIAVARTDLVERCAHAFARLEIFEVRASVGHAHRVDAEELVPTTEVENEVADGHAAVAPNGASASPVARVIPELSVPRPM